MRGVDKRSPSVTDEGSINSAWALFPLCYNNTGKFQTLFQECLWVKILLCIYFVVHDLNLATLVIQVFVWNSIFVTLIHCQCRGNMTVIQVPSWASVVADPGRREKGRQTESLILKKKKYFLLSSNFKLFKQKKVRQQNADVVKDRNFCQVWPQWLVARGLSTSRCAVDFHKST